MLHKASDDVNHRRTSDKRGFKLKVTRTYPFHRIYLPWKILHAISIKQRYKINEIVFYKVKF